MLSYMKCGKTECEKPRLLEKAFCEEHAAAERETAQPLINQKIPLDECLVEYRNNGSQLFMRFEDETVLRFELAERGTTLLATQPPQRWCPLDGRSCEEVIAICKPNSGYYLALVTPEIVQRAVGKFGADLPWCSSVAQRINEALRRSDDSA